MKKKCWKHKQRLCFFSFYVINIIHKGVHNVSKRIKQPKYRGSKLHPFVGKTPSTKC